LDRRRRRRHEIKERKCEWEKWKTWSIKLQTISLYFTDKDGDYYYSHSLIHTRVYTLSPIPLFYTLFYALVPHPFSIVVPFIKVFFLIWDIYRSINMIKLYVCKIKIIN
jgi:hypothetical protein